MMVTHGIWTNLCDSTATVATGADTETCIQNNLHAFSAIGA